MQMSIVIFTHRTSFLQRWMSNSRHDSKTIATSTQKMSQSSISYKGSSLSGM